MRGLFLVGGALLVACAAAPAPTTPVANPSLDIPRAPPAVVVDTTALKAKADDAVTAAAAKMHDVAQTCESDWLETGVACRAEDFAPYAKDYQAYYGEQANPAQYESPYYSLARLGGPTRNVEQVTADLVEGCEDGCRTKRNASIGSAVDTATEICEKANTGFAPCAELRKKLATNVRASEVERWVGQCEGRCEHERTSRIAVAKYRAEVDRKRPKTKAEATACQARCRKQHEGEWCGTPLYSCLSNCTPKGESFTFP